MSAETRPFTAAATRAFRERGLAAKKSFGQNFLVDPGVARQIAELAAFRDGATVVEVGAGLGALTEPLLARGAHVIAVERDRDLCPILRDAFAGPIAEGKLVILEADAKQLDLGRPARRRIRARASSPAICLTSSPALCSTDDVHRAMRSIAPSSWCKPRSPIAWSRLPASESYGALTVFVSAAFHVSRALP